MRGGILELRDQFPNPVYLLRVHALAIQPALDHLLEVQRVRVIGVQRDHFVVLGCFLDRSA
ncbi:hypothetical protein D3C85_1834300 [compost metagenome]